MYSVIFKELVTFFTKCKLDIKGRSLTIRSIFCVIMSRVMKPFPSYHQVWNRTVSLRTPWQLTSTRGVSAAMLVWRITWQWMSWSTLSSSLSGKGGWNETMKSWFCSRPDRKVMTFTVMLTVMCTASEFEYFFPASYAIELFTSRWCQKTNFSAQR